MKSYKVVRRLGRSSVYIDVYEHITNFDTAQQNADALKKKTGDTCYVVEYESPRHHQHRIRRKSVV